MSDVLRSPDPADGLAAHGARLEPELPPPPTCPRPTVRKLNQLVAGIDLPGWQAADIGASARLGDGRLVWLFGDTIRSGFEPFIVANSMLVSSGRYVSQLLPADDGPVIPDAVPGSVVRWPMSVVVIRGPARDVLVVLCSRVRRGAAGVLDLTFLGTSAAVFTVKPGGVPRLARVLEVTPDSADPLQVNWGAAAERHGRWVYVYGTRTRGRLWEFGRELYVGRAPVAQLENRSRRQFWDGTAWQPHRSRAAAILPASEGVSQTLSVHHLDGHWVAVSKRGGDLGDAVYRWTAPNPWGPWHAHRELEAPDGFDSGVLSYAPLAHPEVELARGGLLVSVSRNATDLEVLLENPEVGRPYFVEVPR